MSVRSKTSTQTTKKILYPKKKKLSLNSSRQSDISLIDDSYSDRIRCDHPSDADPRELADQLRSSAEASNRGKIMTMVEENLAVGLEKEGFHLAGLIPHYYKGQKPCAIMTHNRDENRLHLANPNEVKEVENIVEEINPLTDTTIRELQDRKLTKLASPEDAATIAELISKTFQDYPTPSHEAHYIAQQIEAGTPFRTIEGNNENLAACASADLVFEAQAAELTDCATRPEYRKKGYMRHLLAALIIDLKNKGYKTAYTFARARIPGVNVAFKRLGFKWRGRLSQSCRIGDGLEDMNIWSKKIE